MTDDSNVALLEAMRPYIGKPGAVQSARDPVNQPMIRHWCDAMEDHNPVYTDPGFAAQSVHGGIVAPATMLFVWTMPGNIPPPPDAGSPQAKVSCALDAAGYTSSIGTNTEYEYLRYLRLGDHISAVQWVSEVSPEKQTGLGLGRFVTTTTEYRDQHGEVVGRVAFRVLRFKPGTGRSTSPEDVETPKGPRPLRPRPGLSYDTQFFWDGLKAGELRIQRCIGCGTLHHPPRVRCPQCGGYDMGYTVSSGKGIIYSFVEPCYPKVPAFDYPYVVGLVELAEGTRLLTNIVDLDPGKVTIGMPVELVLRRPDPELTLPMFRAQRPPRRETTLGFDEIQVGDEISPCPIPVTTKLIVAGALASRDYTDFHHDLDAALKTGSPNISMNILTTGGLCGRYISDWAGPEALMRSLKIRLGSSNYPHDTMTMSGSVLAKKTENGKDLIEVGLRGYNSRGDHVTGSTVLELPSKRRA